MLNRPRPRKIVSVIKTSPSAEEDHFKQENNHEKETSIAAEEIKPKSPVVPHFSNKQSSPSSSNPITISNPRKPIVATLKKAHIPPPPSFSDSPKSATAPVSNFEDKSSSYPSYQSSSINPSSPPAVLSPKSSGESFLDAADKAADFIGGAFLNSFKSFNMNDTSTVNFSNENNLIPKKTDDPFADIMKKLKSSNKSETDKIDQKCTENVSSFSNLMDEEPPESFNDSESESQVSQSSSHVKSVEASPLIKAAFVNSSKPETTTRHSDYIESSDFIDNSQSTSSIIETDKTGSLNNSSASSISFLDSYAPVSSSNSDTTSNNSNPNSFSVSPRTTGFRASILKHGLSALEKIGKSTADVVVNTRNKLAEPSNSINTTHSHYQSQSQSQSQSQMITPDYSDEKSTFYDILKLYGGYAKMQELQLKSVRASISIKLSRKNEKNILKTSSYDFQARLRQQRELAGLLHPDKIMQSIDDSNSNNLLFLALESEFSKVFPILCKFSDEICCIQRVLKSLEAILVVSGDEPILISSNRRRHIICQVSTVFASLLQASLHNCSNEAFNLAKDVSLFASQIIKYLQTNFARNCEDHPQVDLDQQLAIKLILDISYSIVPQLQNFILLK